MASHGIIGRTFPRAEVRDLPNYTGLSRSDDDETHILKAFTAKLNLKACTSAPPCEQPTAPVVDL